MQKNPVKFVSVFNSKAGSTQVIPLQTWEQLSAQPKALKNLEFMFNCDEDGNRAEAPIKPVIENLNPTIPNIDEVIKAKKDGKAKKD